MLPRSVDSEPAARSAVGQDLQVWRQSRFL
jgi:hypothetical protein